MLSSLLSFLIFFFFSHLYSLNLVSHNNRVLFTDLGGGLGLVIIGAVVLVGVPVDATEQVATATVEPWRHKSKGSELERLHKTGAEKTHL